MLALALLIALAQQPGQPPTSDFERGRTAYDRGEYGRAIRLLRPLLYPEIRLESEGEIVQAHRMLGVAHLFQKQNDMAAQEFRKLLQLRPDYRFDPLLDPPQVVDFFNGVLKTQEGELAQIEARRHEAERQQQREQEEALKLRSGPTVVEKRYARNSFAVNFLPFGAGQFQNGERGKGWAFFATELTLGVISVGAFVTNFALYGVRSTTPCTPTQSGCSVNHTDEDRSRLLTRVQVASGGLFFAVAAWGIADAIFHHKAEVPLQPVLLDGGLGARLAFRF